jgi:uncharacterized protein (TIRG00374 family)
VASPPISRRSAKHGIAWFLFWSALGLLAVFRLSPLAAGVAHARAIRPEYLLLGLALAVLDGLLGALRIHVFAGALHPPLRFRSSLAACLANVFVGGVTPSQTGGGPAQIYVLWKDGMPFAAATVSSVMCFLNSILVLLGCAVFVSVGGPGRVLPAGLLLLSRGTVVLFAAVIGVFLFAVLRPARFERLLRAGLRRVPALERALSRNGRLDAFALSVHEYHGIVRFYLARARHALIAGPLLTALIYGNKFSVAWVVLHGLGGTAPFGDVLFLQMLQFLVSYFAPSPGASGVAEVTAGILMGRLLPPGAEGVFAALWRMFTLYLGMLAGGLVFFRYLFREERGAAGAASGDPPPS